MNRICDGILTTATVLQRESLTSPFVNINPENNGSSLLHATSKCIPTGAIYLINDWRWSQ